MLGVDATLTLSAVGGSAEFAVVVLAYSPPLVAFPPLNKYKFFSRGFDPRIRITSNCHGSGIVVRRKRTGTVDYS